MLLHEMQRLLARLYDAPVDYDVYQFLVTDRAIAAQLSGIDERNFSDEQVLVAENDDGVQLTLYIDSAVLQRLERCDPLLLLDQSNLRDYCTALEGVSHLHYLAWSVARSRRVSLLELEVQAEVDKYASAVWLLTKQSGGSFPESLHRQLFDRISYADYLNEEGRHRYAEANHYAARFCRALEQRFLKARHRRPEAWLAALQRFYRFGHMEKMRYAAA